MYDLVIIGGGSAGLTIASRANRANIKCCLVNDTFELGGECLHNGCVPSKALIHISDKKDCNKASHYIKNIQAIIQVSELPTTFNNIDFIKGRAVFVDKETIIVNEQLIKSHNFVVATGSYPRKVNFEGIEELNVYTNENIFDNLMLDELVIVGGGPIGLEIGQALSKLGTKVTILEAAKTILPQYTDDIRNKVLNDLGKQINIVSDVQIQKYNGNELEFLINNKKTKLKTKNVLLSIGRISNTMDLKLDKAGIDVDTSQNIIVDKHLETSQNNIYACGDVIGNPLFSHTAYLEGKIIFNNIFKKKKKEVNYDCLNAVIFTKPEIFILGKPFASYEAGIILSSKNIHNDRHICDNRTNEIIEILVDEKGFIMAAQAYGEGVGDYMHLISYMKMMKCSLVSLEDMIFSYPTNIEILQKMANYLIRNYIE